MVAPPSRGRYQPDEGRVNATRTIVLPLAHANDPGRDRVRARPSLQCPTQMPTALRDPEYLLRGVAGDVFGRSFPLLAPTTVGRSPECDIYLDDTGVSRQHARLRPLDYGVEVEDLGSTNGSFINGQRISVGIAGVGDEVAFDQLRFRIGDRRGAPTGQGQRPTAKSGLHAGWYWLLAVAALAAASAAYLLMR